uniref:Pre-mRNA-splicing factor 38 n=1 Tax=Strombidinopsis acuminata TaxID=141414 RepID=A0A7S3U5X5_9SPIT
MAGTQMGTMGAQLGPPGGLVGGLPGLLPEGTPGAAEQRQQLAALYGGNLPPGLQPAPPPQMAPPPGGPLGLPLGMPPPPGMGGQPPGMDNSNPTLAALLQPPPGLPQGPPGGQAPPPSMQGTLRQREEEADRRRQQSSAQAKMASEAETKAKMVEAEKKKCHLHKKPKNGCKFCKKYQEMIEEAQKKPGGNSSSGDQRKRSGRKPDRAISEDRDNTDRRGPLEIANPKSYGFSGLLQTHVVECAHFKSLLTLETFEQLVDETYQFANSVEPYMANSGTLPSALFCCLYRFFTLSLDSRQLQRLIDSQESPYIRCAGFLYVRYGLPHDQLLPWLGEYVLDDEDFKPSPDSEWKTTIGEYVEGLIAQDKYFNTVLPRLPMVTRRHVEERLAPLSQNRKRMQANKAIIDTFRDPGVKIEGSIGGEWVKGSVIELDEELPTRPKVRVRLEDGSEEYVHLGKVILSDRSAARGRSRSRGRGGGRGRSRSRSGGRTNWSFDKGRSDKELLDEMRSKEREKAVCSTGKDYARKPVGYKAACALPREQGAASYRLMEEETFVPMNRQKTRRSPTPDRGGDFARRPSAEHQARMQQLFEKYGNQKAMGERAGHNDVDQPDVMRLG